MIVFILNFRADTLRKVGKLAFPTAASADQAAADIVGELAFSVNERLAYSAIDQDRDIPQIGAVAPSNWRHRLAEIQRILLIEEHGSSDAVADEIVAKPNPDLGDLLGIDIKVESVPIADPPMPALKHAFEEAMGRFEMLLEIHHSAEGAEEPDYEEETAAKFKAAFARVKSIAEQGEYPGMATIWHAAYDGKNGTTTTAAASEHDIQIWLAAEAGQDEAAWIEWQHRNPDKHFSDFMEMHLSDLDTYSYDSTELPVAIIAADRGSPAQG